MKRKAILAFAALLMVVSGVAAVSAYEAHIINVTAHVENALAVQTTAIEFGTVFPQEWLIRDRTINLSTSANATLGAGAGQLTSVSYAIWAEWKLDPGQPNHLPSVISDNVDYYAWLGDWLWVGIGATTPIPSTANLTGAGWTYVGAAPTLPTKAKPTGLTGTLASATPQTLRVMLLAPAFHGYYNVDTDVKPGWWPLNNWPLLEQQYASGWDGGVDLKVQVTNITRVP